MTTVSMRWLLLLWVLPMLSGCTLPMLGMTNINESNSFSQGLDQYINSGELTLLKQLPQEYPQGEWRAKAESMITLAEQLQQQQRLLDEKNQELANLQDSQELMRCQQEKNALAQDNALLEKTLQRLKEVLIDTELQAK